MSTVNATKISYAQQDGFIVEMDYRVEYNINGDAISIDVEAEDVTLEFGDIVPVTIVDKKAKFKTKRVDSAADLRKAFVNWVQGTDAQLARYIVRYMDELDAEAIIGVHDCFRGSINDVIEGKLQEAIKKAYTKMFATTGEADVLYNFTKAMKEVNSCIQTMSQNDANGYRRVKMLGGKAISSMINECGFGEDEAKPYFFAK